MKHKKKKNLYSTIKKSIVSLFAVIVTFTALGLNTSNVSAATIGNVTKTAIGYNYRWTSNQLIGASKANYGWADDITKIYVDGALATCFDPSTYAYGGAGYNSTPMISDSIKVRLARLAVANNYAAMGNEEYAAWQIYQHTIMFAAEGFKVESHNIPNLQGYFTKFENTATNYWKKPTFDLGDGTIHVGETKTFNVTNGVASGWNILSTSPGVTATFSAGVLTVTNNNTANEKIDIVMQKAVGSYKRLSMVYNKAGSQQLATFGIDDPDRVPVQLENIRYADIEINKLHEYTGEYLTGVEDITFGIFKDGELVESATINPETGSILIPQYLIEDGLALKETSTSEDFYLNENEIALTGSLIQDGKITLDVTNKPIPRISTQATGQNGEKVFDPTIDNLLFDTSRITNANPYIEHTIDMEAWIYDVNDSTGLSDVLYKSIRYENVTLPEADMLFVGEVMAEAGSLPKGTRIYFTEKGYESGKDNPEVDTPLFEHDDREDPGQTIYFEETEFKIQVNKIDKFTKQNIVSKDFEFTASVFLEDELVDTVVANGDPATGIATILTYGIGNWDRIEIKETGAPQGYLLSDEVIIVTQADFDENYVYSIEYFNTPLPDDVAPSTGDSSNIGFHLSSFGVAGVILLVAVVLFASKKQLNPVVQTISNYSENVWKQAQSTVISFKSIFIGQKEKNRKNVSLKKEVDLYKKKNSPN